MTNQQARICKKVLKYKKLGLIITKSGLSDSNELQDILGPMNIEISGYTAQSDSDVTLSPALIEELEQRRSKCFDTWFTRILSIIAIFISVIALLSELGILKLK